VNKSSAKIESRVRREHAVHLLDNDFAQGSGGNGLLEIYALYYRKSCLDTRHEIDTLVEKIEIRSAAEL
jgi:hypothetical protein